MEKKSCSCAARTKEKFNAGLTKDAKAIVEKVEGYSKEDRTKKAAEVKAAFPPKSAATTKKSTAAGKSTTKAAMVGRSGIKTVSKAVAKPATAKKSVAKPSSKKMPAPAGLSKGSHSGDMC